MLMLCLLWLAPLAPGCSPSSSGAATGNSLRILGGSLYCGRSEPSPEVRQAGDADSFDRLLAGYDLEGAAPDFEGEIGVLVALGERPSLGYHLEPAAARVPVRNGTAIIPVTIHEPPPDAVVGQAVTSPCLLLGVERAGVAAVEVRDRKGNLLGRTRVD